MSYCPHTEEDRNELLRAIGAAQLEDLFTDIPDRFTLKERLNLPAALSEQEVSVLMAAVASENMVPRMTLLGAGAYNHYIPAVVRHITSRSEFYTAYTPYQAEMSQGILQIIYEYQSMIAKLTGTQVANASMYDGATAMAEAAVLAAKSLGHSRIVVARSVHPEYRRVLSTYAWANGYEVAEVGFTPSGRIDVNALATAVSDNTAACLIQSPNFFGVIEDVAALEPLVHKCGALLVAGFTEATSLGILKPAGEMGADFVVGEGQSFGNPLNFGGPYLGIFAASDKFLRKIPGRLVGMTVDKEGNRGFVLTLQTREQHIRREKATSNICSNEALCALAAAVYLVSVGKNLKTLAVRNLEKARYLKTRLLELPGWEEVFSGPTYNEFVLRCPEAKEVNEKLRKQRIVGGYEMARAYPELGEALLFCATEMLTKDGIDAVVSILK
ncbi:MAG: aminomethyl-transferring glycine dehydrogenase subunit GcvPA [Smithellaceae bacterium]|nr:aminomethyl-transferring glycine dehydrogenase subunit GcvPA [Smithellaceae bacterium]